MAQKAVGKQVSGEAGRGVCGQQELLCTVASQELENFAPNVIYIRFSVPAIEGIVALSPSSEFAFAWTGLDVETSRFQHEHSHERRSASCRLYFGAMRLS